MKLSVYTPKFATKLESALLTAYPDATVAMTRSDVEGQDRGVQYHLTVTSAFNGQNETERNENVNKILVDTLSEKMRNRITGMTLQTPAEATVTESPVTVEVTENHEVSA